jgi:hypothetical protein
MLNDLTNDYYPIELPNVLLGLPKGSPLPEPMVTIKPYLRDLVLMVAKRHPNFKLLVRNTQQVYESPDSSTPVTHAYAFDVYTGDGRSELGIFYFDIAYNGDFRVGIDNNRMSSARRRGTTTYTKDLKKAAKLIDQHFYGKTIPEQFSDILAGAGGTVSTLAQHANYGVQTIETKLEEPLRKYALDHRDVLAESGCVPVELLDQWLEAISLKRDMNIMSDAWRYDTGICVAIIGDQYFMKIGSGTIASHTSESLPPYIRGAIGMLKLVEERKAVPGVGARVSSNGFFLLKKEEEIDGTQT